MTERRFDKLNDRVGGERTVLEPVERTPIQEASA